MYDYSLGGGHNYAADRAVVDKLREYSPEIITAARHNREFLIKAVRYVAGRGVGQFLDLGSGLPTQENVHQAAQAVQPAARTVYVDKDPIVLAHAEALLTGDPNTAYVHADIRDTQAILAHPETVRLIDFTRPVAVLAVAILHYIDDACYRVIADLMAPCPPGSMLIISHGTADGVDPDLLATSLASNRSLEDRLHFRTKKQVARFFTGMELVGPGIVPVEQWTPTGAQDAPSAPLRQWCAVAVKP